MKFIFSIFLITSITSFAQDNNKSTLKINEIMKGKDFVGYWPENAAWHVNGKSILFDWNPENSIVTSRYSYSLENKKIVKVNPENPIENIEADDAQNEFSIQYFTNNGNLWAFDKTNQNCREVLALGSRISSIQRTNNPNHLAFQMNENLFLYDAINGTVKQITFFRRGKENANQSDKNELARQQKELFTFIQEEIELEELKNNSGNYNEKKVIYLDKRRIDYLVLSLDEKYVFVRFGEYSENKSTIMEHFISEDGYTYTSKERPKVGEIEPIHTFGILDLMHDSLSMISFNQLTNIRQKPAYLKEYGDTSSTYLTERKIIMHSPIQSKDGKVIMDIRSYDNKDRWIVQLFANKSDFKEIDNQHDEAWIGGPGISSWNMVSGTLGFYSKSHKLFFQSEMTGYSHLYSYDFNSQKKVALTDGKFEVNDVKLSRDLNTFYLTLNKTHPGDRGFYTLDSNNGKLSPVLEKNGAYEVFISPNEKQLAYLFSDKTNPWELYIRQNEMNAKELKITDSQSDMFKKYKWCSPEIITFKGKDEIDVYARLYKPENTLNKPAVIFVHGAGYLQNAHNYWSSYYREYMFHNILKDNGFTVLDIDYRASEGYGRDYRTAIYRHMGGMDLQDQISGKKFLVDSLKINPEKVGIYGGSYGGFITLMALLTTPNEFACGAALRSVTDWLHYNHEYTSNILNYPSSDSVAYRKSSPIYYAENLTKPLLILHGMVDDNVQFQDVVRLTQRFIELEKKNWEMAIFPVEGHGFVKFTSWTDEYSRIYDLFVKELLLKQEN